MVDIELEEGGDISANSELRIITLELMKLASKKRKPFQEIAREYIANVYRLRQMLDSQKE